MQPTISDIYNAEIRCPKKVVLNPTASELKIFDFNQNKLIDQNAEEDTLIRHRHFVDEINFLKNNFDFKDDDTEIKNLKNQIYNNYKLGVIANFFEKTGFQKDYTLQKLLEKITEELMTSAQEKKTFSDEKYLNNLYHDIKYNHGRTYMKVKEYINP